ncbi:hypothetical protein RBH26_19830 [Natronolimnohabitans sp. A-GB9]|uniref:hypothetical protein n=1 Tax=Natronolimnohabitans sp. A-GB9 TaxID=3069757 RepID=UPI0027B470D1|nr:hypothetical protein [Natronolimnohabitans sp. A-GB9]MDQ2052701.1 hypothetical protein [Natronolimnohabitans sp. A-GB9]
MTSALRIVGLGVVGITALWVLLEFVAIVIGLVSWVVSTIVSLAVLALILYVGYVVLSAVLS